MKKISLKIVLACAMLLIGALTASALDGVAVIVNKSVAADSISVAELKDIYTGRTKYWPDGQSVGIVVLAEGTDGKTDAALEEASGMDASHFKTFWQRLMFSGRGQQPQKFGDTVSVVAYVASTKGAIAIVLADADLKDVKILEVK